MKNMLVLLLLIAFCQVPDAFAQSTQNMLTVSLLTIGPGEKIYERFGHTAIRIQNPSSGYDYAYNWGMFDFHQPRFIQRFLSGDTRYYMQGFPTPQFIATYRTSDRAVWEQQLAVTQSQAESLRDLIRWNAREENKYYRYHYYLDNCSTRPRDLLDKVLAGALRHTSDSLAHRVTYRSEMLRLTTAYPLLNLGMSFLLGRRGDVTLSALEEAFIPMRLRDLLNEVHLQNSDGSTRPLVIAEHLLSINHRYRESASPPQLIWPALLVGLGLALLICALAFFVDSRPARLSLSIIGALWHLVTGISGGLLIYLALFTSHTFSGRNMNMLLATPVSLILAALIPRALVSRPSVQLVNLTHKLGWLVVLCASVTLLLRMVPALKQDNLPFIVLAIPVHLALVYAVWRVSTFRHPQ